MGFSQREVNQIFGHVPSRTLRQWGLDGLYQWSGESEDGRGVHRTFSLMNLYQIGICEILSKANIQSSIIKRVMAHFFVGESFQEDKFALDRMNHILVIAESHKLIDGVKGKSSIIGTFSKDDFKKQLIEGDISNFILVTRIDLEAIKNRVDSLISESK